MKNEKEQNLKCYRYNNKAITLISLVITIIILLILVGISIGILTGDNGLFARAKQAKENTIKAQDEENLTLTGYETKIDEVVNNSKNNNGNNGGNSDIGSSEIIKEVGIEASVSGRKITLKVNPVLNDGYTKNDIAAYICLFNGEVKEVEKGENIAISKLEPNTKYSIYVIAVDKYAGMIKSSSVEKTTENINIIPLEYPIVTKNGIVNVKLDDGNSIEYDLDLDYDCTATDALDKAAYDGDETTFVDVTTGKTKFYFGDDIDIYQVCFKIDDSYTGLMYQGLNARGTIMTSENKKLNNGYLHCTYYGKGTSHWRNFFCEISTKMYEIYYDGNIE